MIYIVLGFLKSIAYLILIKHTIGFQRAFRWEKWIDIATVFVVPTLLSFTFAGLAISIISGVCLTIELRILKVLAR